MSFGLRTWSEDGTIQMDTDTFTYQVIYNQVYRFAPSSVFNVPIPGFSPSTCVATLLPTGATTGVGYPTMPYMAVGANGVSMYAYHPLDSSIGSNLECRLLVMRYK